MNRMNTSARKQFASIVQARELGFTQAKLAAEYLDELITAAGKSTKRGRQLNRFKEMIVINITENAELRYSVDVQGLAMGLMAHDHELTPKAAIAVVENIILVEVIGSM